MELKKKITLEKQGEKHNLPLLKKGENRDIVCNLNWSQYKKNAGFFTKLLGGGIDLDLGVYWEMNDGTSSLIDGLQFAHGKGGGRHQVTKQGSYDYAPWVWHAGDDRTGSSNNGEFIYVNPKGLKDLKRIQFYAMVYDSKVVWGDTNAEITINIPGHETIAVNLGRSYSTKTICVFCTISFTNIGIEITNETSFHNRLSEADKTYGWGFSYTAGKK